MKQSRFTTEQSIAILKRAEAGEPIVDICRSAGISATTFARWRAKYSGIEKRGRPATPHPGGRESPA